MPRDTDPSAGYALRGTQGRVIDAIGRAIISGRWAPGEALPREPELAAQYGASRTSIREAMKVLAAKGLVEIRPKVGTTVRSRDTWDTFDSNLLTWFHQQGLGEAPMQDLVELRQILEPSAARLAAGRASMADLRRMSEAMARLDDAVRSPKEYALCDVDLHLAVYSASHNSMLQRFGRLVADFMVLSFEMQQAAVATVDDAALRRDVARHAAVVDAINRSDPEAAAEAMLAVVLDGKAALAAAFALQPARRALTG